MSISDNAEIAKLESIAKQVRAAVELWVEDRTGIDANLCGACAVASYALWQTFKKKGVDCRFVVFQSEDWGGHCWVELNENIVIDITSTQFKGGTEIAVFEVDNQPDWFSALFDEETEEENEYETYNYDSIGLSMVNEEWPEEQTPKAYMSDINKFLSESV